jgi:D-glycero-D-manno-heptose 1,7-bisphosphate phosphatase
MTGAHLPPRLRRALLLDRDGTLIVDHGYLHNPARVQLVPGATAALRRFRDAGWLLVVASNQSGVGRGLFGQAGLDAVHQRMLALLSADDVQLDGAYYCTHAPADGCDCRKPKPGMLQRAARELSIDLQASLMVGDKASDVEAGVAAGARGLLFHGDWSAVCEALSC